MLQASSLALSSSLTDEERSLGQVFPSVDRIRDVSARVAAGVMLQSAKEGNSKLPSTEFDLADGEREFDDVVAFAHSRMWRAKYAPLCSPSKDFTPGD